MCLHICKIMSISYQRFFFWIFFLQSHLQMITIYLFPKQLLWLMVWNSFFLFFFLNLLFCINSIKCCFLFEKNYFVCSVVNYIMFVCFLFVLFFKFSIFTLYIMISEKKFNFLNDDDELFMYQSHTHIYFQQKIIIKNNNWF